MSAPAYSDCSLYIIPHADEGISGQQVIAAMHAAGFSGEVIDEAGDEGTVTAFLTGPRYLELINYLGCAPSISFEPPEDGGHFCHIRLHAYRAPRLVTCHRQPKRPQCRQCGRPVASRAAEDFDPGRDQIRCDHCGSVQSAADMNWRRSGGCSRLFIEVTDIFPREALPQPSLLAALESATSSAWQYFYACRNNV